MTKSLDELKCIWVENGENDSNVLVEEKESEESKCRNNDSSVIEESNDDHNDSNISTEKQKAEEPDKNDAESDSGEEDFDSYSGKKSTETDWKEELLLREELIKLAVAEGEKQAGTQNTAKALQELSEEMRAHSEWLLRTSSRLVMGAVATMRRNARLKVLEIRKQEESQAGPLLFEGETLQAADASHNEKKLKPKKDSLKCFYCHEEGHFRRDCPKRLNVKRDRSRGNWHQPRGGWNQTRGTSGYRGSQIRDREGYQNRRPYMNDQYDERPQRPPYEHECNEQHWAGAHENWQRQSEFENEKASHNPLN